MVRLCLGWPRLTSRPEFLCLHAMDSSPRQFFLTSSTGRVWMTLPSTWLTAGVAHTTAGMAVGIGSRFPTRGENLQQSSQVLSSDQLCGLCLSLGFLLCRTGLLRAPSCRQPGQGRKHWAQAAPHPCRGTRARGVHPAQEKARAESQAADSRPQCYLGEGSTAAAAGASRTARARAQSSRCSPGGRWRPKRRSVGRRPRMGTGRGGGSEQGCQHHALELAAPSRGAEGVMVLQSMKLSPLGTC